LNEQEFKYWTAKTQSSTNKWTEDEIFRLNGRGSFYYIGGADSGTYIKIHNNGLVEGGTYEDAFPISAKRGLRNRLISNMTRITMLLPP